MLFLRKHTYLILGLLVGIVISGVILLQRGQQQTSTSDKITPDVADQTPEVTKPPPPGESKESGFWLGDHWHKTSPTQVPPTAIPKRNSSSQTEKNITLKRWIHGPHIIHHHPPKSTWPDFANYGLSQEQIDRFKDRNLQWQTEYGVEAFFNRRWEHKGQTQEEWEEEGRQKRVENFTVDMDSINAFKYLAATTPIQNPSQHPEYYSHSPFGEYLFAFAERAVAENPDFLEGCLFLAQQETDSTRGINAYRAIVEHPDVHANLSPTDTVTAFENLGNLLVMEQPVESIELFKQASRIDPKSGLYGLSVAYQRLGDVKTAWVYLKKLQTYPHTVKLDQYVAAIESGKPLIEPLPISPTQPTIKNEMTTEVLEGLPEDTSDIEKSIQPDFDWHADTPEQNTSPGTYTDADAERARAAAEAAQHARDEFMKTQELRRKEFEDFLQWAETVMNADPPMDTNNFLMKEMEAFLKGGKPQFEPERIIRGFEIMERYGAADGIKRLQKVDPDLAKQVQRLLSEKRTHQQHQ